MNDIQNKINAAKQQAQEIEQDLRGYINNAKDANLKDSLKDLPTVGAPPISCKRTLKGHQGKIYSMHWAAGSTELVSAAQDGVLIVWDGLTTNKTHAVPLACQWVMTCAFAPSGNFVACGGLDNTCSVFNLQGEDTKPIKELTEHGGHLSSCRFLSNSQILTGSGDGCSYLWDIETGNLVTKFSDHLGGVLGVSIAPNLEHFVSGSVDQTAKLFDIRTGSLAQMSYRDHKNDVNAVDFFPGGTAFGTGSEDNTCKIFDLRFPGELISFDGDSGVTSVAFSHSGKLLFSSYSIGGNVKVWDVAHGNQVSELKAHKDRISSIGISGDGRALATACWDRTLKIYA